MRMRTHLHTHTHTHTHLDYVYLMRLITIAVNMKQFNRDSIIDVYIKRGGSTGFMADILYRAGINMG